MGKRLANRPPPNAPSDQCLPVSILVLRNALVLPIQFHLPDKFYKGRSQEKTRLQQLKLFLLRSPIDGVRSVLTGRTMCSVAGHFGPAV